MTSFSSSEIRVWNPFFSLVEGHDHLGLIAVISLEVVPPLRLPIILKGGSFKEDESLLGANKGGIEIVVHLVTMGVGAGLYRPTTGHILNGVVEISGSLIRDPRQVEVLRTKVVDDLRGIVLTPLVGPAS